jgi:hypothetical protein
MCGGDVSPCHANTRCLVCCHVSKLVKRSFQRSKQYNPTPRLSPRNTKGWETFILFGCLLLYMPQENKPRVIKMVNWQTRTEIPVNRNPNRRRALPPGLRVSKNGKIYFENRANRSYLPNRSHLPPQ